MESFPSESCRLRRHSLSIPVSCRRSTYGTCHSLAMSDTPNRGLVVIELPWQESVTTTVAIRSKTGVFPTLTRSVVYRAWGLLRLRLNIVRALGDRCRPLNEE